MRYNTCKDHKSEQNVKLVRVFDLKLFLAATQKSVLVSYFFSAKGLLTLNRNVVYFMKTEKRKYCLYRRLS